MKPDANISVQLVELVFWVKLGMLALIAAEALRALAALISMGHLAFAAWRFINLFKNFNTGALVAGGAMKLLDRLVPKPAPKPAVKKETDLAARSDTRS